VVAFVVLSTLNQPRIRCRACVIFEGRQDCRTVSASNRQEALRTAVSNACAQLASGVTDSIRCENTPPASVEWLQ
jgi:hypothetical protein